MILKNISPYIALDEIIIEDSPKYVHFITHFDQAFIVPNDWHSIIYTSRYIADLLIAKKTPIPPRFLKVITENESQSITLPNRKTIAARMFSNDQFFGNAMFYFESTKSKTLYTGPFVTSRPILLNEYFRDCILSEIDDLYIDNEKAHSTSYESLESVADRISDILREHPGYSMILNTFVYGYEDLICLLAKDYGCKVFVGSLIYEADIIVGEARVTAKHLKRRITDKRLTVNFVKSTVEQEYLKDLGIYFINWTPHPSLFELRAFIDFVKPANVYGIYGDTPTLPECLTGLCRRKPPIGADTESISNVGKNHGSINMLLPFSEANGRSRLNILSLKSARTKK
ncbi:unnamed protein product [Hermetia illucens]|uniref:Uncharacterized protein n=1 Tax=Hermetia illucens TaxID=343691 RepID=A0A7R8YYK6_HERIL|nr:uncharacterized protein LOC119657473 isoform X2 [Hermetia illucens]CAD7090198.1 unnamed protein product [Hermetia illucens]